MTVTLGRHLEGLLEGLMLSQSLFRGEGPMMNPAPFSSVLHVLQSIEMRSFIDQRWLV